MKEETIEQADTRLRDRAGYEFREIAISIENATVNDWRTQGYQKGLKELRERAQHALELLDEFRNVCLRIDS
jgi:hypothetical protein